MSSQLEATFLNDLEGTELVHHSIDLMGGAISFEFLATEEITYQVEFREIYAMDWKADVVLREGDRYLPELYGLYLRKPAEAPKDKEGFWSILKKRQKDPKLSERDFNVIVDFTMAGMFFLKAGVLVFNGQEYRLLQENDRKAK